MMDKITLFLRKISFVFEIHLKLFFNKKIKFAIQVYPEIYRKWSLKVFKRNR